MVKCFEKIYSTKNMLPFFEKQISPFILTSSLFLALQRQNKYIWTNYTNQFRDFEGRQPLKSLDTGGKDQVAEQLLTLNQSTILIIPVKIQSQCLISASKGGVDILGRYQGVRNNRNRLRGEILEHELFINQRHFIHT